MMREGVWNRGAFCLSPGVVIVPLYEMIPYKKGARDT